MTHPDAPSTPQAPSRAALLRGFAHELRNLVGVFMGGGELLADELEAHGPDPEAEATLQDLRRAGERARRLLARLSGLAALEAIDAEVFAAEDVLAARVPRLQRLAVDRRLQVVVDSDVPPVAGSPALFEAILADLVDNAARATAPGGAVTVRLLAGKDGGATLCVGDDGGGMTPVHAAQAFEPFFTSHPGRWGLGLPMVQAAAEAMGGRVAVETRRGQGTTVRVDLPAGSPPRPRPTTSPEISAGSAAPPLALVVDDDPLRCTVLRRRLEGLGVEVLVAGHPEVAPLLLAQAARPPALLVLPTLLTEHVAAHVARDLRAALPVARVLAISRDGEAAGWADATVAESDQQALLLDRVRGLLERED
jgi:CheY-like chemotaxis protein